MVEIVGVQVVEGMSLRARPHVDVDVSVVEGGPDPGRDVGHEMLPHLAARIGQPVRKPRGLREQQQAHVVVDERREDDDLGLDRVVRSIGPVIGDAGRTSARVAVHAVAHRAGDQREVPGPIGLGQRRHENGRLGADMAAKRLAEAAVGTRRPPLIRPRDDRARRRERAIPQLARGSVEDGARLIHDERRQRILAAARRFERVAAVDLLPLQISRLARHAECVFGAIVKRLEIAVRHRPIDQRRIGRNRRRAVALDRLRARAEVVVVKTP